MADRNNGEVTFEIMERGGLLEKPNDNGWVLEVNLVAWNGGKPKIDIRSWSPDHQKMTRGITLTETQAEKLAHILSERYRDRNITASNRDTMER